MPKANVRGLNMYYEFAGEGEPLVLIMGLGLDHLGWMNQVPAFSAAGYRCLAFDNRDVGQTDESPVGPYTIRQCADDTVGLLDELNIHQAHVVGVSMGGMIAQELAINYPEHVRSLTLASTFPVCESIGCATMESWKNAKAKFSFEEMLQLEFTWTLTCRFYELPGAVQRLTQVALANPFRQSVAGFQRQCDAIATHNVLDRLVHIASPTHVVVGGDDILTPPRHSRTLAEKIPGAKLTQIPEAGHLACWEKAMEFNEAVLGFLKEH